MVDEYDVEDSKREREGTCETYVVVETVRVEEGMMALDLEKTSVNALCK